MDAARTAALVIAHETAITLAGDDFRWEHPDAPSTLTSAHRRGLLMLLAKAQGGVCVACGDALEGAVELCHVVASRVAGRGILPGSTYVGHKGCNDDDAKVYGDVVPLWSLVAADRIALAFPTRAACLQAAITADAVRAERRNRRAANA